MSYRFLVVDDSATTRALVRRAITLCGFSDATFVEAENGKVALDKLSQESVDMVLADLHMPEMSGVELTRQLLADPQKREIPVVIISAEPDAKRLEQLKQQGVRACLRKPFTPEMVRQVIHEILGAIHA